MLPFTQTEFFDILGDYNQALWPFVLALWMYALAGAIVLARHQPRSRFVVLLLAVQWAWAGVAYHAAYFTRINPAAWLFAAAFLLQSGLFVWFGLVRDQLRFSPSGSGRHVLAWFVIVYALLYPMLVELEGHVVPAAPTFGVPCPTTLLTIGFLLAVDLPWPRVVAVIPLLWAFVGGSAAALLGVRTDLMLWMSGAALAGFALWPSRTHVHA